MKECFFAALFAIVGTGAVAQLGPAPAPAPKPKLSWVAPQTPEIQRLVDVLAGRWETTERFEASQFLKSGAGGTGVFSIRKGPGGNSIVLDYTSQSSMGQYSSERIIYWIGLEGNYRAFYCDSLQATGCGEAGTGRWEGKDLVFESPRPRDLLESYRWCSDFPTSQAMDLLSHWILQSWRDGTQPDN